MAKLLNGCSKVYMHSYRVVVVIMMTIMISISVMIGWCWCALARVACTAECMPCPLQLADKR